MWREECTLSATTDATTHVFAKVKLSMVSLKTGDVLSTLIPGSLALYAVFPHVPFLKTLFADLTNATAVMGIMMLIAACLAGGVLEAFTRIGWECWLQKRVEPPAIYQYLKDSSHNLDLFELAVQSSYKYATFYANLAWAVVVLLIARGYEALDSKSMTIGAILGATLVATLVVLLLLRASYVQWTYYVKMLKKIFGL